MNRDAHLTRLMLDGAVEHRGGQQFVDGAGFAGDRFRRVHRIEPHGFASHPVAGGIATIMSARGARDSAYAFGGENPAMRPTLDAGGSAIYDSRGNIVSIVQQAIRIVHATAIEIVASSVTITGDLTLTGDLTCSGDGTFGGSVTDADGDGGA
ncbi:hypothetical protein AY599_18290 [Leptolyngbya valderiana BDU 20041]|nr:hypothetical protein AY599_18290 [Leptolyngbya valderiana BDU 20041]